MDYRYNSDNENIDIAQTDQQLEEEQKDKDKKEEKSIFWYVPYLFIFTIILFFCVFGITYSVYKGTSDDQEMITDQIIFSYSDVDQVGNGIYIQDATPISDSQGKVMVGKNQYFDFYITATTGRSKVSYQLLLNKDESSTLKNENVRIYLTQVMGGYEEEKVLSTFSDLRTRKLHKKNYYILYEKRLEDKLVNYSDSYRLRMWINENAKNYENQYFSVKIDVHAVQVER